MPQTSLPVQCMLPPPRICTDDENENKIYIIQKMPTQEALKTWVASECNLLSVLTWTPTRCFCVSRSSVMLRSLPVVTCRVSVVSTSLLPVSSNSFDVSSNSRFVSANKSVNCDNTEQSSFTDMTTGAPIRHWPIIGRPIISRLPINTKKLTLVSYLSYLFRLRLLSENLQTWRTAECGQNNNAPKSKVIKRSHFYRKRKTLSCFNKWHT